MVTGKASREKDTISCSPPSAIPLERESNHRLNKITPMTMKTDVRTLIVVAMVIAGTFLTTVSAQIDAAARESVAKENYENAVDVRPQYDAALKQKRDGKFLLYTDDEGTKLFLPVNGGQPGPPIAVDKGGRPVASKVYNGRGGCFICLMKPPHRCIRIKCGY
jgi:hypothetical protein